MKLSKERYFGLGQVPIGIGAVLKGWNIQEDDFKNPDTLPVIDFRAMTNACPHDCFHCFTDKNKKTLTFEEIRDVIDQIADLRGKSIDYLGEGEPTLDKDFLKIIEYTAYKGVQPVIFTEATTKMRDRGFVRRVYDTGATVVPKCDSLWNPEYQNWVVRDKTGKYFDQRNKALDLLMEEGFNEIQEDGSTRLGFDMVISAKNVHEVEKTLRYCRENNLWTVFAFHLPAGRSGKYDFDKELVVSNSQRKKLKKQFKELIKSMISII